MKVIRFLQLGFILGVFSSCQLPMEQAGEGWKTEGPGWSVKEGVIHLEPQGKDSILWSPNKVPKRFNMTFQIEVEEGQPERTEIILVFLREGMLPKVSLVFPRDILGLNRSRPEIWEGSLIWNYKWDTTGPWSALRSQGIYKGNYDLKIHSLPSGFSGEGPGIPLPEWKNKNLVELVYQDTWMTFRWNGVTILDGVPLLGNGVSGEWGFAHYWKNKARLKITNLVITNLPEDSIPRP